MIKFVLCALLCVVALCIEGPIDTKAEFDRFIVKYQKKYLDDAEYSRRFAIYQQNKVAISKMNSEGNAVFAVNKFADLSPEEFKARYLNYRPRKFDPKEVVSVDSFSHIGAIPSTFDWRTKGAVTAVKDQGNCGSCWAFSTTEEVESMWNLAGKTLAELSPQQIVSCDTAGSDGGCNGGDTVTAYSYVKDKGLQSEKSYPYKSGQSGEDGRCLYNKAAVVAHITGFTYAVNPCKDSCLKQNETALAIALATKGPISICVYAATWQFYSGGVFKSRCTSSYDQLDHCVQLVGYDKPKNYWLVRNSWASDWGESGYINLEMGKNLCGVADEATFATVAKD